MSEKKEEKVLNIYQRMAAITAEISRVAKNLSVGEGRSSYKAVGEADVLVAVKPLEEKFGVYSYPVSRTIESSGTLEKVSEYKGEKKTSTSFYMRVCTVYRFVNLDNPSEFIDVSTYGDGVDSMDKAPGKAMTYADKYALLKAYKIMTGDDPDQSASEEVSNVNVAQKSQKEALAIDWAKLRTELTRLGADLESEEFNSFVCQKSGVNTQDIRVLSEKELGMANNVYRAMILQKSNEK